MKISYPGLDYRQRSLLTLLIVVSFITRSGAYDRNHGPIPYLAHDSYRIHVDGAVPNPISLTVYELAHSFPQHAVTCALQCAGNRRHTMRTFLKEVDGIDWGDGAVMNCEWRGPRLRDVLSIAGVTNLKGRAGSHVAFSCYHTDTQNDSWYGGSILLERGLSEEAEVILALEVSRRAAFLCSPFVVQHDKIIRLIKSR